MLNRLLGVLLGNKEDRVVTRKCSDCKSVMERQDSQQLFLLPVFQQDRYTPSVAFYQKHCWPIAKLDQIPARQRACRFWLFTCPACGRRKVLVEDFLQERNEEVVAVRSWYDYRYFKHFWNKECCHLK